MGMKPEHAATREPGIVRASVKMIVAAALISLSAAPLQAAAAGAAAQPTGAAIVLAQGENFFDDHRVACPYGQHFACWYQPYGSRFCGCWPGGDRPACPVGYHYTCRPGPNGYSDCACY